MHAYSADRDTFRSPLPDDNDYEYDVYLFYPSSWPPVLFPEVLKSTDVLVVYLSLPFNQPTRLNRPQFLPSSWSDESDPAQALYPPSPVRHLL